MHKDWTGVQIDGLKKVFPFQFGEMKYHSQIHECRREIETKVFSSPEIGDPVFTFQTPFFFFFVLFPFPLFFHVLYFVSLKKKEKIKKGQKQKRVHGTVSLLRFVGIWKYQRKTNYYLTILFVENYTVPTNLIHRNVSAQRN